jgi:error-prone DNA polymerase
VRYAELHCKTNFSFLEGASHPDELVRRARELEYCALAVTDRNSLAGAVRAHIAAKEVGLPLVIGAEITPVDAPPVVLWATNRASYGRLCRLITRGRRLAPKGECMLKLEDVAEFAEGLLAGIKTEELQIANCKSQIANWAPPGGWLCNLQSSEALFFDYRDIFDDRCYLLAELHCGYDDQARLAQLRQIARTTRLPLVATGDVHYHVPARMVLHDVLTAIRHGTTVAAAEGTLLFPNAQRHLRSVDEIRALFAAAPDVVARTVEIADRCRFSLEELRYEYPTELAPAGQSTLESLTELTWQGAAERYPAGVPEKVSQQLEYE